MWRCTILVINLYLRGLEVAETLKECRVDILENITPPEIAWELRVDDENFIPLGTNGNFSLVKGKAKSKKTFFTNMAIATTVGGEILHNRLRATFKEEPKQVFSIHYILI